eukprot:COSAG03_NODE_2678_length_2529_cov_50.572016_3_plen_67_part_00
MVRRCASDWDCSLNGRCNSSGHCACDAGWGGLRCGTLLLGKVDRTLHAPLSHSSTHHSNNTVDISV